ncbi:hypothetical protein GH723_02505 [Actinomarinicola tropica]|uniref:Uncharacterized protein n=1 Tax=Actinomarinicola tropica TaxID=2789776 RepID=A0A5Q2REM6_9ACTN|nr:hypothetical protein GH723_02505 [Actinomarinicola tropica]
MTEASPKVPPPRAPGDADPWEVQLDLGGSGPGDAARLLEIASTLVRHGAVVAVRRGPFIVLRLRRRAPAPSPWRCGAASPTSGPRS